MYSILRLFELKNTEFKIKQGFFTQLSQVLEVVNFRYLGNFRFLILTLLIYIFFDIFYFQYSVYIISRRVVQGMVKISF